VPFASSGSTAASEVGAGGANALHKTKRGAAATGVAAASAIRLLECSAPSRLGSTHRIADSKEDRLPRAQVCRPSLYCRRGARRYFEIIGRPSHRSARRGPALSPPPFDAHVFQALRGCDRCRNLRANWRRGPHVRRNRIGPRRRMQYTCASRTWLGRHLDRRRSNRAENSQTGHGGVSRLRAAQDSRSLRNPFQWVPNSKGAFS